MLLVVDLLAESFVVAHVGFVFDFVKLIFVHLAAVSDSIFIITELKLVRGLLELLLLVDNSMTSLLGNMARFHFAERVEVLLDVPKVRTPVVSVTSNGSSLLLVDDVIGIASSGESFSMHQLTPVFGVGMVLVSDFALVCQDLVSGSVSHASSHASATSAHVSDRGTTGTSTSVGSGTVLISGRSTLVSRGSGF